MKKIAEQFKTQLDGLARDEGDVKETVKVPVPCSIFGICREEGSKFVFALGMADWIGQTAKLEAAPANSLEELSIAYRTLKYMYVFVAEDMQAETTVVSVAMLCDVYEDSSSHTIGFAASGMHRRISAKSLSS